MIEAKNIIKTYKNGPIETQVLKGINLKVDDGEYLAIMGRSGAGKSTLLYQLSLLDHPTKGVIIINDRDASKLSSSERTRFRLKHFGYVFQDYALLPELTALENVVLPLLMEYQDSAHAHKVATTALERVGLGERLRNLPSQLSGGEQQRASIARAIAHKPQVLFADEPSANLDRESSDTVMELFRELHREGQTILMVTHEEEYGKQADKIIQIDDGLITSIHHNR